MRAALIGAWFGKLAHVVFRRRGNGDSGFCMLFSEQFICIEHRLICYDQIQKGANGARADDTKGMKGLIIDWITPKGQYHLLQLCSTTSMRWP